MRRVILDTDMGSDVDDALCLALALASPEIELVAVTTVSRDTRARAQIARRLLDLAGRRDVPVYAGCERSRSGGEPFVWFGNEGAGILGPGEQLDVPSEPAVDALARLLRAQDDLEVCAVGPLTNLAELLERAPDVRSRVRALTVMGGHLREAAYGGATFPPGIDYNLCSDPAASLAVLRAGLPTRLIPVDVTLRVWLSPDDLGRIEATGAPLHLALGRAVRAWSPIQRAGFGGFGATMGDDNVAFLHDALALASLYDESFCRFEDLEIEPAVIDGVFRTIERPAPSAATRRLRCATAVDAERFGAHFVERVLSLAR